MANFDYSSMADTALSLLEDFGNPFTLKKAEGTPVYNPKTKKTEVSYKEYSGTGVMLTYDAETIGRSNNIINAGDMKFLCQLDDTSIIPVESTDKILFEGITYNIINKAPINPSGSSVVVFEIQTRRVN